MDFDSAANVPFSVLLGNVLEKSQVVEDSNLSEKLPATATQLAMEPGDYAILAGGDSNTDESMIVMRLVDPEDHRDRYSEDDIAERSHGGYVLCAWTDQGFPVIEDVGWFPRVRLLPVSEEQYTTLVTWFREDNLPDKAPPWVREKMMAYTRELSALAPGDVARAVPCGKCGSEEVVMKLTHTSRMTSLAGQLEQDGEIRYVPFTSADVGCVSTGYLHCTSCHSNKKIEMEELAMGQNDLTKFLRHHLPD